uniref:Uncharacterized protein n=1 Tax=Tanacetum cinerariifolium TaxID=118510 RepID=A0A6L2J9Y8_TANCI|nr:hypothetical protein [Tanacetum cinerariifolium]
MSPEKVARDVSGTRARSGFTGVKSAAGLSPQPSRAESTTEPSPYLNDLDNATLHIDSQSTEVDAPPDIIDLDEDDDIIDDEDALPRDLADSDNEDLVNVDDDGVDMSADVARGHGGDDGGDDRPPTHHIPIGCEGCFVNRGKGTRKPNLGGRKAGRLHTCQETRNLGLKKITDDKGPVLIREMPLYYPFWQKVLMKRKAAILTKIGTQFDLTPHMQSQRWTNINAGIQQHLQVVQYQQGFSQDSALGYKPRDQDEPSPSHSKSPKSNKEHDCMPAGIPVTCSPSRSDELTHSGVPIHTFFVTHTVNGVFTWDEDRAIYEEMLRLLALGSNTPSRVPYTKEEINALDRKGKQRGHLPGPGRATNVLIPPPPQCTHNFGKVEKLKKKNKCGEDEMASDEDGDEDEEDEEDGDS